MAKKQKVLFIVKTYSDHSEDIERKMAELGPGWEIKDIKTASAGPVISYSLECPWGFKEFKYTSVIIVEKEE